MDVRSQQRRLIGWLIDVMLIITAVAVVEKRVNADIPFLDGGRIMSARVVTVGPFVTDLFVSLQGTKQAPSNKLDCKIDCWPGGGAFNVANQVHGLGMGVLPILMCGPIQNYAGIRLEVDSKFGKVLWWHCLKSDRMSLFLENNIYTVRPATNRADLTGQFRQAIAEAAWTVIAPMTSSDRRLVASLIRTAHRSILMLSSDQLADPTACLALMSVADITVLNQFEAERLTGWRNPHEAVQWLRERGVSSVMVTSRTGVHAFVEGNWYWQSAFQSKPVQTVGAGDVFVGTLAAGLARKLPWKELLQKAMAACALHVEDGPAADQAAILHICNTRPQLAPVPPKPGMVTGLAARFAVTAIGASLLFAITYFWI